MQTPEPLRVPWYTSPKPPEANGWVRISNSWGESKWDVGRIALVPQMHLSSRRHFRNALLEGSRTLRACACLSGKRGKGIATGSGLPCPGNR